MNGEILAFILYLVAMIGISVFFFFKSKDATEADFFLGGRQIGPWVTALSAQASDMSAWLLMGLPGSILAFGMGQTWIAIGLALGTAANWIFVAKRLRTFSKASDDAITLPQYLTNRFKTKDKTLQVICAIIFLVCFTVYVASAFSAGATLLTTLFSGITDKTAMLIFAIIVIIYTFMGGFKGVCWTDFIQALMMIAALLAVPILAVATQKLDASTLDTVYTYTDANGAVVEAVFQKSFFSASAQDILSGLAWGLGYFGMPHILVRFMGIKKPSMIKTSSVVAIIWVVFSLGAAFLIAYFGRMMVGAELLATGSQKMVFITMARKLFPTFVAGLLMSGIMAASMSTADSQLLVAASSFTSDIYRPFFRKNASEKEILWVSRLVVLAIAVVAYLIASAKGEGAQAIMNMVENAWGGFGSAFGPVVILSLFWRRFNYQGAVAGVIAGAVVDVVWLVFLSGTGIYELLPGFVAGLIVSVVVTLLTPAPSKDVTDIFDVATAEGFDE